MSLYGTGRSEGIAAVVLVGLIVLVTRALGGWLGDEGELLTTLAPGALPAIGGMLAYRFLRAQGRSRYSAFLVGAAYGLSPWLLAMHAGPREQLAAALAPLALEAVSRIDRPTHRARWLPWAWAGMAAPFVAGLTVIGVLVALLCAATLARTIACGDREAEQPPSRGILVLVAMTLLAAGNLVWLAPLDGWLPPPDMPGVLAVMSVHRPADPGIDLAAVLRVPGPALLTLALLGLLRRQRHVDGNLWLGLAIAGGLPTLFTAVPWLAAATPVWASHPWIPTGAWWLTLLAIVVLAAAGLDDFLDLPLRRRTALPWLLAIAVATAPWLPVFGAQVPAREWPLTATFVALPLVLTVWRRLGILRFKNWLATVVLVALAIPMLQARPLPLPPPAAPLDEAWVPQPAFYEGFAVPVWRYAGLLAAFAGGCWLAASAFRRNHHARKKPAAANAAIVKKARPAQRS